MRSIKEILRDSRTVAVVGMSNKPERDSYIVARYLQEHGYRVIPVNPNYAGSEILGEKVHASLTEAADSLAPGGRQIDIVDCFRKSADIPPVAREAIGIRAACLWMQLGVENQAAADMASAAGLDVVMDRCIKIDHAELQD
ncbi:CoA-binding protein [Massilia cavernae]|uniref:CoA-binding protein n=1 Tax=Massilia cavernae TaxID=2320864 RepID=A0A418XTE1_9BURK|nr:CoA-binding protein [Massilia cavernae]RJG15927.1 CoA-binding protein [Massilia cavernae]